VHAFVEAKKLAKSAEETIVLEHGNRFANSIRWFFKTSPVYIRQGNDCHTLDSVDQRGDLDMPIIGDDTSDEEQHPQECSLPRSASGRKVIAAKAREECAYPRWASRSMVEQSRY
jgi:hypothetical protein